MGQFDLQFVFSTYFMKLTFVGHYVNTILVKCKDFQLCSGGPAFFFLMRIAARCVIPTLQLFALYLQHLSVSLLLLEGVAWC